MTKGSRSSDKPLAAAGATQAAPADASAPSRQSLISAGSDFSLALAKALTGAEPPAAAALPTDTTANTTDKSKQTDDKAASGADPVATALALVSQSFVAALPGLPVTPPSASTTPTQSSSDGDDSSTNAVGTAPNGVSSAVGPATQTLVSVLTDEAASASKESNNAVALQTNEPAKTSTANDASAAVASPNTLAHMSVASHFSLQHSQASPNSPPAELRAPVGTPAWNDELGNQITWMAHQGLESASLRLSPEHLGPMEVHISVQNGDASVWFGAAHADTRTALEQALPRLREMFATQGLTLADTGVSREPPRGQSRPSPTQSIAPISSIDSEVSVTPAMRLSLGLVDTYA